MITRLSADLLQHAYVAFSCRHVDIEDAVKLIREPYQPKSGDVVLACIKSLGQHKHIELPNGRKPNLAIGDLVILAYGNRYAPDQFEGLIPNSLVDCAMVAAGGIAAQEVQRNAQIKSATTIQPLGVLANAHGRALNLFDYRCEAAAHSPLPPVFVVCGTSVNAGKTHTAAGLIRGLSKAGYRVGGCKVTGAGSGGDVWRMRDAGALRVVDFTDAGYASTYLLDDEALVNITDHLLATLADDGMDMIVMEIAGGLSHLETRTLLQNKDFMAKTRGVLFAAADAMGATTGAQWLRDWHLPLIAISGRLTLSPLAVRELCALVDVPVVSDEALQSPADLRMLLGDRLNAAVAAQLLDPHHLLTVSPGFIFRHDTGDVSFDGLARSA